MTRYISVTLAGLILSAVAVAYSWAQPSSLYIS
jgi:hypothetical protein